MLYLLLGILCIIAEQSILFLRYYENGYKIRGKHMIISIGFMLYVIWVVEYWHDKVLHYNVEMLLVLLMFIPIGLFMPMLYRRYRFFLTVLLYALLIDGLIFLLQGHAVGKINILLLLFSAIGCLLGFCGSSICNCFFPELRKKLLLKKKKKKIITALYELELVTFSFAVLFMVLSTAEKISGENFGKKLKDTIYYTRSEDPPKNAYEDIYYADADKVGRYDNYAAKHPEFLREEVVWRVNANLDREFYDEEYVRYADADTNEPLLINKFNRVSDDFVPEYLETIEGTYEATPETVEAYHRLTKDLAKEGMKIYVVSAYRSVAYQRRLHNGYLRKDDKESVEAYSARAGYSEHHTGRALDISQVINNLDAFEGSEEAEWVYDNAYRYGFIVRYKQSQTDVTGYIFEPWHIVYVGEEIAETMHEEHIETLEEYVVKYIDHKKP